MLRRWPTALGVVFAASLVAAYWFGFADWERLAEVLAAAGLVYLGAAALGLRSLAWPMFGIAFVLITIGFLIPGFTPFWWMVGSVSRLSSWGSPVEPFDRRGVCR